ncbi:MAG: hypothetical protein M3Q34_01265 [bacterium]|nr:hypothetical protein [bacterium]
MTLGRGPSGPAAPKLKTKKEKIEEKRQEYRKVFVEMTAQIILLEITEVEAGTRSIPEVPVVPAVPAGPGGVPPAIAEIPAVPAITGRPLTPAEKQVYGKQVLLREKAGFDKSIYEDKEVGASRVTKTLDYLDNLDAKDENGEYIDKSASAKAKRAGKVLANSLLITAGTLGGAALTGNVPTGPLGAAGRVLTRAVATMGITWYSGRKSKELASARTAPATPARPKGWFGKTFGGIGDKIGGWKKRAMQAATVGGLALFAVSGAWAVAATAIAAKELHDYWYNEKIKARKKLKETQDTTAEGTQIDERAFDVDATTGVVDPTLLVTQLEAISKEYDKAVENLNNIKKWERWKSVTGAAITMGAGVASMSLHEDVTTTASSQSMTPEESKSFWEKQIFGDKPKDGLTPEQIEYNKAHPILVLKPDHDSNIPTPEVRTAPEFEGYRARTGEGVTQVLKRISGMPQGNKPAWYTDALGKNPSAQKLAEFADKKLDMYSRESINDSFELKKGSWFDFNQKGEMVLHQDGQAVEVTDANGNPVDWQSRFNGEKFIDTVDRAVHHGGGGGSGAEIPTDGGAPNPANIPLAQELSPGSAGQMEMKTFLEQGAAGKLRGVDQMAYEILKEKWNEALARGEPLPPLTGLPAGTTVEDAIKHLKAADETYYAEQKILEQEQEIEEDAHQQGMEDERLITKDSKRLTNQIIDEAFDKKRFLSDEMKEGSLTRQWKEIDEWGINKFMSAEDLKPRQVDLLRVIEDLRAELKEAGHEVPPFREKLTVPQYLSILVRASVENLGANRTQAEFRDILSRPSK